ncbi:LysR family transcriptional regulator [Pandoraea nosoerga]|uniref:LysR family transcriptional regulator n=1 Tax=Pandoraea nosoerga TaxID=2508296 RepID=A0A5E4UGS5_9BURK|nr:LysR family transcriptional regulator [Pandoraea nosoerga]MBN4667143.1 LysR family transcriptional regulator [Pandoraea nosoerga]MBN4677131.1 LysR family transcriptional regulator [Pandoraea nosoerga]MBN4681832.1 LysR family transcriptional regulator [Pandoraea nosoerga]MBN4746248.1 LysR family transcriptional regulator [Pandoraea nosoerga]VVD98094.1 LysR family transcriptional regulator [Pandoraea nosoerga]
MDQLLAMRIFHTLAETRSFSAAADALGMSHSSVSRQLKRTEAALGVALVNRSTRRFSLTGAGERYHRHCADILARVDAMAHAMSAEREQPSGALRVTVPLVVGTLELPAWLPAFRLRYPDITLALSCSDQYVDLLAEGFDAALRISSAPLADSSLMAKGLTASDTVLVASPTYLAQHGLPASPDDLARHHALVFAGARTLSAPTAPTEWTLSAPDGSAHRVVLNGAVTSDAITAVFAAALAGAGIAAFTERTVRAELARGTLVRVLPQYSAGRSHYYALYPHTRHVNPKVRAFVDFMAEHYRQS